MQAPSRVTFAGLDDLEKTRVSRVESSTMPLEEMKVPELVNEMDLKAMAAGYVLGGTSTCGEEHGGTEGHFHQVRDSPGGWEEF